MLIKDKAKNEMIKSADNPFRQRNKPQWMKFPFIFFTDETISEFWTFQRELMKQLGLVAES